MEDIQRISHYIDLVYSPDDNSFYFQEYAYDGKGTTRESELYRFKADAVVAYCNNCIEWKEWH